MPASQVDFERTGTPVSIPTGNGAVLDELVAEFCQLHGLINELAVAVETAKDCFKTDDAQVEIARDYETDDQWLVVRVRVPGTVESVLAAKKENTARWIAAVAWPKRHQIRLSYVIV